MNKLVNVLGIYISLIKNNICNGKTRKVNPVDSIIKNKEQACCYNLPFTILTFYSYLDTQ